jgi:hypothetical protein
VSERDYRRSGAWPFAAGGRPGEARFRSDQFAVSLVLREMFDGIAAEPLPSRIVEMLRRLDAVAECAAARNASEPSK